MSANPLHSRLAALRRRLWLVVTFRGFCALVGVVLLATVVAGTLDWRLHLPGLVRAVLLVGMLAGAGCLAYRLLVRPLAAPSDDLALALRVEAAYPFLNDSLASTVQFLEQSGQRAALDDTRGSPVLRREAVRRTMRQVEGCNFRRVVNSRGTGAAGLLCAAALGVAALLYLHDPALAWTALERFAVPFGARDWPRQTGLEIFAERRVARGDPFEIRGLLTGVIPEQARITFEGLSPASQICYVRQERGPHQGTLAARLERVERSFRFQVQANDAVSDWYRVSVEPPPVLVPLDGRPSPHVRLHYPTYTDLPEQDLPDGTGNVEAVVGTAVTLRAAADRPLSRAWVEYRPEQPLLPYAAGFGLFGADSLAGALALAAVAGEVNQPVAATLSPDRHGLTVSFLPRVRGLFALRFVDETGLGSTRLFDLHLLPDPAPAVNLERPSRSLDSLFVLPGADVTVQIAAEDPQFGVRSVYLAYRCRASAGDAELTQRLSLYDHQTAGQALAGLGTVLAARPIPVLTPAPKLRPTRLQIARRVSLTQIKHADGKELQEGDVVTIQACADDFDDVAVDKQPGRSHEIDLHIVSRATLDAILNREQAQIQEELLRLRKEQQEALQRVIGAEQRWRNTGRLRPQDIDQVLQAEQLQQQIRTRVGSRQEGLRADVERVRNTLRDNRLPRSGTHDRMETIAGELDRLTREELEQIEPHLTNARKESEAAGESQPPPKGKPGPLGEARAHQEEVENTLNELLKLLEPWGNLSAVKGEARAILQEQKKLNDDVNNLGRQIPIGQRPEEIQDRDQKSALSRAAELQRKLEERADQLLGKMQRAAADRKDRDPALAAALQEAVERGQKGNLKDNLQSAGQNIRNNRLGQADANQKAGMQALEEMVQALEERREQELDRLRKKLKAAEQKLADLTQRQQALRKKMKEAARLSDPKKREEALKRLAREQEQLRKETQEMVRELTRMRADQASQALAGAGGSMDQAGQQLQRGQDADDAQEEALDRLNEAQRRTQQAQAKAEDELARERLAKVADQLRQLRERQQAAAEELGRIQQSAQRLNGWHRGLAKSLADLAGSQQAIGQEVESLAKGKLAPAKVFARTLTQAGEAMQQASERMTQLKERVLENNFADTPPDPEIARQQQKATRRLDQLLDALKSDRMLARGGAGQEEGDEGDGAGGGGAGAGRPSDGVPQLAELKVLRALQQEVYDRTQEFGKRHPKPDQLPEAAQRELTALHKEQQEIADLLEELTAPAQPEGGRR